MIDALMQRLARNLDGTTRSWMTIFGGDVLRMALGFIASVLIARALDPAAYGHYVVLGAVSGIAGATADFGLSASAVRRIAAVRVDDAALARRRARVFFWLRVAASVLTILPLVLFAGLFVSLLGLPAQVDGVSATALLLFTLLGVPAGALSGAISTILQATGQFRHVALVLVANTALTVVLALGLWLAGQLTLVTALLVLGVSASLVTFLLARRFLPAAWRLGPLGWQALRAEALPLLRFGRWLWLASMLGVLALQLDILLLNRLSVAATVGSYGLALNLANKVDVVNRSLYTVLLPTASALKGRGDYARYIRRGLLRSALICLLLLPLVPLAQPFILFFYGQPYAPAVPLFRLLLVAVALDVFSMPLLLLAFPLNRPRWLAAVDGLRLIALLAAAFLLIPSYGATGAGLARIVARAAGVMLLVLLLGRRARSAPETIKDA